MSNAVANGLAGAGGGIIAQIITYPLQTVNTRQQTERVAKKGLGGADKKALPAQTRPAAGTLLQILQVLKTEGWGGLYSGLKPSLFGTAASQGVYYYFYQVFKNRAEAIAAARKKKGRGDGTVGMFSWLVVAAIAGSLNVLLTIPIWVLVTRMQTHTQAERKIMEGKKEALLAEALERGWEESTLHDKLTELESVKPRPYGTLQAAQEVHREAGVAGFWKGIIPTLIMVCNPSIQFMIYETSLKHLRAKHSASKRGLKNVNALEVFLLGALAKLGATVSTYPLLVVKMFQHYPPILHFLEAVINIASWVYDSLLEVKVASKTGDRGNVSLRYTGTFDAIIKMIRYEGVQAFYKGMSTKIVQSVFAASVLFMIKEELVKAYMLLADKGQKVMLDLSKRSLTKI